LPHPINLGAHALQNFYQIQSILNKGQIINEAIIASQNCSSQNRAGGIFVATNLNLSKKRFLAFYNKFFHAKTQTNTDEEAIFNGHTDKHR